MSGLFEAAELQGWWATHPVRPTISNRSSGDDPSHPAAAVTATDFGDATQRDAVVLPDATTDWITAAIQSVASTTPAAQVVMLEAHRVDDGLPQVSHTTLTDRVLERQGFVIKEDGLVESWLVAAAHNASNQTLRGRSGERRTNRHTRPRSQIVGRKSSIRRPHNCIVLPNLFRRKNEPEHRGSHQPRSLPRAGLLVSFASVKRYGRQVVFGVSDDQPWTHSRNFGCNF